jgi:regulator of replication initiation timing
MTPKNESEKLVSELLQGIDPRGIADTSLRQTIEVLLNFIEELNLKVKSLEEENQKLRDENNRLKGEKGKPDIKASKTSGFKKDHSSEKERKTPSKHTKSSKNANIKIDRKSILEYPESELPSDAEFKGYEEVIVQDISLKTDNVLFLKQKFYSEEEGKTYLVPLPAGYDGEFGPGGRKPKLSIPEQIILTLIYLRHLTLRVRQLPTAGNPPAALDSQHFKCLVSSLT